MTIIDKYDEFLELQARYPRSISNDFILPSDIKKRFGLGLISAYADDAALYMLERREGFYKLHFRLADASAEAPARDGTLAAYLIYHEGRYPAAAADWLVRQGVAAAHTLVRHTSGHIMGELSEEGIGTAPAEEVYAMFGEYFSAAEADMPDRAMFDGRDAYCARCADGRPLGILYDMGPTRLVAVSAGSRGQGIGRRLYLAYAAAKIRENKNQVFREWIGPDNRASIAMYRSLGFVPDNTITDCFIRGSQWTR